jgi:hypothetical protein
MVIAPVGFLDEMDQFLSFFFKIKIRGEGASSNLESNSRKKSLPSGSD